MRSISLKTGALTLTLAMAAVGFVAARSTTTPPAPAPQTPATALQSIGPLTFGPDGVLFAADTQAATIYALELGEQANGGAPGTKDVAEHRPEDRRDCSAPTPPRSITDMVVHPRRGTPSSR